MPAQRTLLEAGPFTGVNGEGQLLFRATHVTLRAGEMVVLEGSSGSGKSTLLRQLVGLEAADDAERWLGAELFGPARLAEWRARVTLLAQDAPMIPGSIDDNLELGLTLAAGRGRRIDTELRRRLLKAAGLEAVPGSRDAGSLSGGERHRLALVRGLLWDPPVLIADEPLGGLDPERADACFGLLREQAGRPDRAVLCVLHEPERAAMADRRLVLRPTGLELRS